MDAEELVFDRQFDLVLAGDTLEHMNNPGRFVQCVSNGLLAKNGELVIGVPSAFSFNVLRLWLGGQEATHKDHIAFHSPKTLAELCRRFHLVPTAIAFTTQPADGESAAFLLARKWILQMRKTMSPSLIMHFRHESSIDPTTYFEWN
jgi:2-polyprenyl-3-methyl-5-hydroxy-6-metoxy-1,4-benzoquinol methylase